ncbi:Uu.00g091680.m01.CDS01 [Anthostomella pinea]|uniref:Inactive metallocarboxypeptidase ECM14 n=1 Tax=Anthostomella pinea TaxID=933095 RepID=A0AAI8YKE9_9PEZI|nr:Uu.00g091680.m01.CDS01 [Anthostomella pinea]
MASISLLRQSRSCIAIFFLLFLTTLFSLAAATSLPRLAPPRDGGSSFLRRLLHLPSTWATRRSQKNLNGWVQDHPALLENLRRYEDEVVIRFNVSTTEHEAALRKAIDQMLLDVWDFTANYTDIRLGRRRIRPLMAILPPTLQHNHSVLIPDLSRLAAATYPSNVPTDLAIQAILPGRAITQPHGTTLPKRQGVDDVFFHDYQPLSVITTWMRLLDSMFRGRGLVRMFSIGKSYEGRDILALRVGMPPNNAAAADQPYRRRDTILVTGGLHAREWISTSTVNYVAWSFIRSIDQDPMINKILEHFDIVFIPVLNPDGYEYTWNVDRLWRKSRQRTKMQYCPGFDLDHAFGYRWDSVEHQDEPCSESYSGDKPFQAVEAARLAEWAKNETDHGVNFVGYLDLHSYSQQVLFPYAYSCGVQPPNLENLQEVAMNLAKHMRLSNGEVYTVASACEGAVTQAPDVRKTRTEAGGGSAIDYMYHDFHARHSYQIKLRDTGSYGFLLPSDEIIPTGEEVFQAMKYFGDYLLGNNGHESSLNVPPQDQADQEQMTFDDEEGVPELRRRRRKRCLQCT